MKQSLVVLTRKDRSVVVVRQVGGKATWASTKQVPSVIMETAKLTAMVAALPPTMSYCASLSSPADIQENYNNLMKDIRKCIAAKLNVADEEEQFSLEKEYDEFNNDESSGLFKYKSKCQWIFRICYIEICYIEKE